MKRRLHRCPEPDCHEAFLTDLQLRGHMATHASPPPVVSR